MPCKKAQLNQLVKKCSVFRKLAVKSNVYLKLIRFDKPIGSWLLFWPGAWSLTLATSLQNQINSVTHQNVIDKIYHNFPDPKIFACFAIGTFLMRNAGCIVNDYFDKEYDSQVARTKQRPLAAGQLTTKEAFIALSINSFLALLLLLQLNPTTILMGFMSLLPTISYPLAKRYNPWPQLHLGVVFNWGALMGWTAIFNSLQPITPLIFLFTACVSWTVLYDTVYAHQDKIDDKRLNLHSTALYFEKSSKSFLYAMALFSNSSLLAMSIYSQLSFPLLPLAICSNTLFMLQQIYITDINDPALCARYFLKSNVSGWLIFLALLLS